MPRASALALDKTRVSPSASINDAIGIVSEKSPYIPSLTVQNTNSPSKILGARVSRSLAKLVSPLHSDPERTFIVSVFNGDSTVQVYEIASKNSGRQSCTFMERQKCKNPYTDLYYTPKDFVKLKDVYLNKYIFRLTECDEYTKKYMIDNPEMFRDSDLEFVINRLRKGALQFKCMEDYAIEVIKTLDPSGNHYVDLKEIVICFKK